METSSPITFSHRHNKNGSWDSICLQCYQTAASAENELDLRPVEQGHDCERVDDKVT